MKNLLILIALLAVASAKSIDVDWSQIQLIESIGIYQSQVQPVEDSDQYWTRPSAEMQYLRKHQPDRRLNNGQEATPGQFPYQAVLVIRKNDNENICGGSILNNNMILSVASCIWRAHGGTAIVGAHNRNTNEPTQQRIPFSRVYFHANYKEDGLLNNIAVVRLNSPMTFNDRVQPVRLPSREDTREFVGLTGIFAGFGRTCLDCPFSDVLRYASNPIISNADCNGFWGNGIYDGMMCVSSVGGFAACTGDMGGPLTVVDGGNTLQIGIISFGGCGDDRPTGFTRLTHHMDWLLTVMAL